MSEDMEKILRNALDTVDRGRRWATLGVAALFVAMVLLLFTTFHVGRAGEPGASQTPGRTGLFSRPACRRDALPRGTSGSRDPEGKTREQKRSRSAKPPLNRAVH